MYMSVKQIFEENKFGSYKNLYKSSNDGYVGLSQRKISKVTMEEKNVLKSSIKFTYKTIPRSVSVKEFDDQYQIELVDMSKMSVIN